MTDVAGNYTNQGQMAEDATSFSGGDLFRFHCESGLATLSVYHC